MATNRELYFELKKLVPDKIQESEIKLILLEINGFSSFSELVKNFNEEARNVTRFQKLVSQVVSGVPIQYALGNAPFLDLELNVSPNVLIPRPETEELVLLAAKIIKNECADFGEIKIVDVATGSGAIAISLYRRIPGSVLYATDISSRAIETAKENAAKYGADIAFLTGDMLKPLMNEKIKVDVIISNPPYIEDESTIEDNVFMNEPHLALIAKPATKYYEEIFKNVGFITKRKSWMFFEIGENMEESLTILIKKYLPLADFNFYEDIYKKTRFLFIRNDTYEI